MNLPDWAASIHHDGSELYVSERFPRLGQTVRVRLRAGHQAPIQQVFLRTFPDGEQAITPMSPGEITPVCQWWEIELSINQPQLHYRFLILSDSGLWAYSAAGLTAHIPTDHSDFRILADYHAPEWLETAVFYQIFPDRYANGDAATNPQPDEFNFQGFGPLTLPWEQPPPPEHPFPLVFYGGDLPGITQRLDYLQHLGINALYLNPIFSAHSNHKYDVINYEQVDPHFGGNEGLIELRQGLSERGMRYILDIVPNHCGYWHTWFQKARADQTAAEAEFFTFQNHPDEYETWLGVWILPKLNYRSSELRQRIYAAEDSVFKRWLRPPFAIDGWRIDVANMLGRQGEIQIGAEITREIRAAVKSVEPDAYLMGENFFDASAQLQGEQLDGVMNYTGFAQPLWYWLNKYREWSHNQKKHVESNAPWPTQALIETWQSRRSVIPWVIACQQYNLLNSHDTPRIRTIVGENDALHRLAVILLFTFPGVPGIYYGNEIGLVNDEALEGRGCMIWNERRWNHDLLNFYRRLIALRKESSILQRGGFQILAVETDTFAYQREGKDGRILVIAHRSEKPRPERPLPVAHGGIPDGTRFVEFFSGQELFITQGALPLPAHLQGATLWEQK